MLHISTEASEVERVAVCSVCHILIYDYGNL